MGLITLKANLMSRDFSPYQKKIIHRYYDHSDTIHLQKLGELVSELYLAEGKKRDKIWERVFLAMRKLQIPETRIAHLKDKGSPEMVAEIIKELEKR